MPDYDENSPPEGVTTATKQPIGSVKRAWSNESPTTPKVHIHPITLLAAVHLCLLSQIVQPYRRTIGRLAPYGYDISTQHTPCSLLVHVYVCHTNVLSPALIMCFSVPLLDLSALNEPDDHLQPVQLLQPSTTDFPSHRSLIR